jgi:hypothetical protein
MTPTRADLHFAAEFSCRYHRRRAAFFRQTDTLINWLTLLTSGSAFLFLVGGESAAAAKYAIAVVSILSLTQIAFNFGGSASAHEGWHSRWRDLLLEIQKKPAPKSANISGWLAIRKSIEAEHVNEFRALQVDCRNQAIEALNLDDTEIRKIYFWQRPFLQIFSLQKNFPKKLSATS